jgi:hypothetical protein
MMVKTLGPDIDKHTELGFLAWKGVTHVGMVMETCLNFLISLFITFGFFLWKYFRNKVISFSRTKVYSNHRVTHRF